LLEKKPGKALLFFFPFVLPSFCKAASFASSSSSFFKSSCVQVQQLWAGQVKVGFDRSDGASRVDMGDALAEAEATGI
jgi:hypothetical protein